MWVCIFSYWAICYLNIFASHALILFFEQFKKKYCKFIYFRQWCVIDLYQFGVNAQMGISIVKLCCNCQLIYISFTHCLKTKTKKCHFWDGIKNGFKKWILIWTGVLFNWKDKGMLESMDWYRNKNSHVLAGFRSAITSKWQENLQVSCHFDIA